MIARILLALALIVVLPGGHTESRAADSIVVTSLQMEPASDSDGWLLSADFYLPVPPRVMDTLVLGVPLYFVVEFQLTRSRWWWRDAQITQAQQTYRLSYHPITRQYRLTRSGYAQEFVALEEALASLARIRGWLLLQQTELEAGDTYDAALRMRLDASQLPGPLQIDVLNNQDWKLDAPWKRFTLTPGKVTSVR